MRRANLFWTIACTAAAAAAAHAWALRFTCDDAYVSFRYAQHFVEGHGLVFNLDVPGSTEDPVEGYSNFAWTMWLALGMALGCTGDAVETWAGAWGSLLHGGTALVLAWAAWRGSRGRAFAPIAACAWAAHHHAASLAPAGLETAMFTFLGAAMAVLAIERRCHRDLLLLGFLGVLAAMTRPDGAIWCAAALAVVACDALRVGAPANVRAFLLPFAVAFLPYLLWRRLYYGWWVPNTFYAKSGGDPALAQGLFYVATFVQCYAAALVPAALLLLLLPLRRDRFAAVDPWSGARPGAVLLLFVLPYLAFVVWVGGDFMFARFLLPVTPLALLAADVWLQRSPRTGVAVALAMVAAVLLRREPDWLDDWRNPHGISDNRAISVAPLFEGVPLSRAEAFRIGGQYLQGLFAGLDVRLAIAGSHANVAYRSRVPVAIETAGGLTDEWIAHLPLPPGHGGMRGHLRNHTLYPGYLERRGVHFTLELSYRRGNSADPHRNISFPAPPAGLPARIVTYDRALMRTLRERDPRIAFTDFEQVLDRYIEALPQQATAEGREQVARDFAGFREFYFDHNDDPARRAAFEQFLAQ